VTAWHVVFVNSRIVKGSAGLAAEYLSDLLEPRHADPVGVIFTPAER